MAAENRWNAGSGAAIVDGCRPTTSTSRWRRRTTRSAATCSPQSCWSRPSTCSPTSPVLTGSCARARGGDGTGRPAAGRTRRTGARDRSVRPRCYTTSGEGGRRGGGGSTLGGDMTSTRVDGSFDLAYLVFNTVGNVTTQDGQVDVVGATLPRTLRPGGHFVIETGVPQLQRVVPGERFHVFHAHRGLPGCRRVRRRDPTDVVPPSPRSRGFAGTTGLNPVRSSGPASST